MAATQKQVIHARLEAVAESHSRTVLKVRDLLDVSDEPVARGGTNEGFAPTELLIAALASCTNVISHKIAAKYGIEFSDFADDAEYEFDRRGVTLQEEVDVPFPRIAMTIRVSTSASGDDMKKVEDELPRYCAVSKVIAHSGTQIDTRWIVTAA